MLRAALDFLSFAQTKKNVELIQEVANLLVQSSRVRILRIEETCQLHQTVGAISCQRQQQKLVRRNVGQPRPGPVSIISHGRNPVKHPKENPQVKQNPPHGFGIAWEAMLGSGPAGNMRRA